MMVLGRLHQRTKEVGQEEDKEELNSLDDRNQYLGNMDESTRENQGICTKSSSYPIRSSGFFTNNRRIKSCATFERDGGNANFEGSNWEISWKMR